MESSSVAVFLIETAAHIDTGSHPRIDDRDFPVLTVVCLGISGQDQSSGKHTAYFKGILAGKCREISTQFKRFFGLDCSVIYRTTALIPHIYGKLTIGQGNIAKQAQEEYQATFHK